MASKSDLEQLNKSELYDLAREREIGGRSDMDKEELVEALADGRQRKVTKLEKSSDRRPPIDQSGRALSLSG